MGQKFYANPRTARTEPNGAISYAPGGPFDCVGPFAKIANCPIEGTALRLTCYATGYADTAFSLPACTRYRGRYVSGFFTGREDGPVFVPHVKHWQALGIGRTHDDSPGVSLTLKTADYLRASKPGRDAAPYVSELGSEYYVRSQLSAIDPAQLARALKEYGAWSAAELADHSENLQRFLWLAACAMREHSREEAAA